MRRKQHSRSGPWIFLIGTAECEEAKRSRTSTFSDLDMNVKENILAQDVSVYKRNENRSMKRTVSEEKKMSARVHSHTVSRNTFTVASALWNKLCLH